ncbi:hypothetical protein BDW60DRAFT_40389 [Aspergillus nidulans var. acristatus]
MLTTYEMRCFENRDKSSVLLILLRTKILVSIFILVGLCLSMTTLIGTVKSPRPAQKQRTDPCSKWLCIPGNLTVPRQNSLHVTYSRMSEKESLAFAKRPQV